MATTVIAASLTLDGTQAEQSVKNFKTQLREASANLLQIQQQFGATSDEAIAAARGVAELRDTIQEAREVSELFDPGARFKAFSNLLSGVAGGITAVTGAMALFGAESEDAQKALLKVQSALALSQGLSTILDIAKDFDRLKVVALDAFKSIRVAIGTTGIGLIVIAVGLLVTYFDEIKEALTGVNSEQKKTLETATKLADKEKERLTHIDDQDNILKQQGNTEKQILEIKEKQTLQVIKDVEAQILAQKNIEKSQIETAQRNHDILVGILDFLSIPILVVLKTVDLLGSAIGKNFGLVDKYQKILGSASDLLFDPKATKEKADKAALEAQDGLNKLKNTYAGYQLQIKAINKEAAAKEAAYQAELKALRDAAGNALITDADILAQRKLKQDYDNQIKTIQQEVHTKAQRNQLLTALEEKYQNESAALSLSKIKELNDKIAAAEKEKYDAKAAADKAGLANFLKSGTENIQALQGVLNEVATEGLDAAGQQYQAGLDALNANLAKRLEAVKGNQAAEAEVYKQYEKAKSQLAEIENNQRLSIIASTLEQAANLLGKASVAGKAVAIASATISMYQSAVSSYNSLSGIPIVGPALGFAAAALAVVSGLANIKKIASVQIPGGTGGGSSVPNISVAAPLAPQVATTQLPQDQINQIGQAGNQTVRAFVVESDVTQSQSRIERLNRQSRLGN